LNTVEDRAPRKILDKGQYPVRVVNYEDGVSKAGNAKITLRLEVANGPAAGTTLFDNLTPGSAAALPFVKRALVAFGVQWDDEGFDPVHFIGKTALANVDVDLDDPTNPRNVINGYKKVA
jgi:hypothetical protein